MKKGYKIVLIILVVLLIVVLSIGAYKYLFKSDKTEEPKNVTTVVSTIEEYGYTLDDRDTEYMKTTYEELKNILSSEEIEEEEYAKTLAKLFIIDFYTLNNKINKYDVGSLEYILSDKVDMFKTKAMDTMYNDIIDNTYKDRVQELPEITNVEILSIETTEVEVGEQTLEGYKIKMTYTYKKDIGYDKSGTIYLVKNGKKLEVTKYEPSIEDIEE